MSFEDSLIRKIDKGRHQFDRESLKTPDFERAHERAMRLFQDPEYSIQAPSFVDLYGKENVLADMMRAKKKREHIESRDSEEQKEMKRLAEVFEAIVLDQARKNQWLGAQANVLKASIFDDYFHGADMLAEWEVPASESQVLALSVDITFGSMQVAQKVGHIRDGVMSGKLGRVKYFRNKEGTFRGERTGIPSVVIGVDKSNVHKLLHLWNRDDLALTQHPAQKVLIDELMFQLTAIHKFAKSHQQKNVEAAYARAISILRPLQDEKADLPLGDLENDRVLSSIIAQTDLAFRV